MFGFSHLEVEVLLPELQARHCFFWFSSLKEEEKHCPNTYYFLHGTSDGATISWIPSPTALLSISVFLHVYMRLSPCASQPTENCKLRKLVLKEDGVPTNQNY